MGDFRGGIVARVFDDAFTHLEREIQSRKIEIPAFELLNDAHRLNIVIERRPVRAHQFVQLFLAGVAKGRMSNVVSERKSFGKICIEAQRFSDRPCNLCDFKRVREPIAKMVGVARGENLRLCFETPERAGVNNAVAVAREFSAVWVG